MLDITGGDAAALTEVTLTLDLIAAQDDPDLTAALSLARHRDYLADRNSNIPASLPALWATLGQHIRAEALAASITDPDRQAQALTAVVGALTNAGQHQQAAARASQAATVARSITDPDRQAQALAEAAWALAEAGQHERAETVARSITDPDEQAQALTAVAGALAQAGQHQQAAAMASQAATVARSSTAPGWQAQALVAVAKALVAKGDTRQAHHVASAACAVGQWTTVLELVLSLEPRALAELADL
jgi:tetratricopeptide (TPR) repeat protein